MYNTMKINRQLIPKICDIAIIVNMLERNSFQYWHHSRDLCSEHEA